MASWARWRSGSSGPGGRLRSRWACAIRGTPWFRTAGQAIADRLADVAVVVVGYSRRVRLFRFGIRRLPGAADGRGEICSDEAGA